MLTWRLLLMLAAFSAVSCRAQIGASAEDCMPEGIPASVRLPLLHVDKIGACQIFLVVAHAAGANNTSWSSTSDVLGAQAQGAYRCAFGSLPPCCTSRLIVHVECAALSVTSSVMLPDCSPDSYLVLAVVTRRTENLQRQKNDTSKRHFLGLHVSAVHCSVSDRSVLFTLSRPSRWSYLRSDTQGSAFEQEVALLSLLSSHFASTAQHP
jgi:hypothetical protein